ncbi:predicted protein [Postia placenta Mad-698-R]|nr:predicted protein [Postia placenta Mad-698-R]
MIRDAKSWFFHRRSKPPPSFINNSGLITIARYFPSSISWHTVENAALGLQDDSGSDDFLSSDSDTDDSDPEDPNEEEGGEEHLAAGESDEEDEVEDEVDESDADEPPVSLTEALKDPLYTISLEPEIKACVSCPGRLLKNPTMEEVHRSSNAHVRRYKKFRQAAGERSLDTDVRDILKEISAGPEKQNTDKLSKRAMKRTMQQKKQASVKSKRQKQKELKAKGIARKQEKATAKAESTPVSEPSTAEPQKKRKRDDGDSVKDASPSEIPARKSKLAQRLKSAEMAETTQADGPAKLSRRYGSLCRTCKKRNAGGYSKNLVEEFRKRREAQTKARKRPRKQQSS